ncbi:MAG TPA: DUF2188 domain-containing protein [Rubricoccaceae bacterium]|jgi:hypothetical protein|nr:DUF2188 domain-containing protein [Rubricoccaceae bacterium]
MPQIVYHVVPSEGRWAVKREGADRASRVADTQDEAVAVAEQMARNQAPGRVVVHGANGLIESVHTYDAVPARVESGREWLDLVLSRPVLAAVGVAALVALGYALRERF